MGVPGFFIWLIKKYKNIITNKINLSSPVDIFYLDFNCGIHPITQYTLKKYLMQSLLQKMMCLVYLNILNLYIPMKKR